MRDAPTRTPPHNIEAEQALLGAILANNRAYEQVADFLEPQHFAHPAHRVLFAACGKLIEQGHMVTPVTLKPFIENDPAMVEAGGLRYLVAIVESVVTIINAADYGRQIMDLYQRRELIALGERLVNDGYEVDAEEPAQKLVEAAQAALDDLGGTTTGSPEQSRYTAGAAAAEAIEAMQEAQRRGGEIVGIPSGLDDLDRLVGGWQPQWLYILAARPSMGKSAMAGNLARHGAQIAKEGGGGVAVFSLEMGAAQWATRDIATLTGISMSVLARGQQLDERQWLAVVQAQRDLAALPLEIDQTAGLTLAGLRARCRRLARQWRDIGGLGMVVVDYLQLMDGQGRADGGNRVQEISVITRGLKRLAKEFDVPVIALSQLSREVEKREDKRPQLSDLRDSGSIEQDADVVMFLYREEYYLERAEPRMREGESTEKHQERCVQHAQRLGAARGIMDVICAKNRMGAVGGVQVRYEPAVNRIETLYRGEEPQGGFW